MRIGHNSVIEKLMTIPGVGKSIAQDLYDIGIRSVSDLKGKDPEMMYVVLNKLTGTIQDRCILYVFRCAVYFAEEDNPDPKLLLWWNWKDRVRVK